MKKKNGFTLIELLVIISILGILSIIAIPNVMKFMDSGELEAANTEVANVLVAVTAYMAENGEVPESTDDLDFIGTVKGEYTINDDGSIEGTGGWDFEWEDGKWVKD